MPLLVSTMMGVVWGSATTPLVASAKMPILAPGAAQDFDSRRHPKSKRPASGVATQKPAFWSLASYSQMDPTSNIATMAA
jgi:hypothetical protein